jgi:hypothetical protein
MSKDCIHFKKLEMKKWISIMALLFAMLQTNAQTTDSLFVQPSDFNQLKGSWKGTLTYKDYKSGYSETIKTTLYGSMQSKKRKSRTWILQFDYPDEPDHGSKENWTMSKDGKMINKAKLIEKTMLADGTLKIVLDEKGKDGNDNKPCTIRKVIALNSHSFTITKLVRFDDEKEFFQRHVYQFTR